MRAALIYPHQLFPQHPAIGTAGLCFLIEDPLFFRQYRFHAAKLVLHRASMQQYRAQLEKSGRRVVYVEAGQLPQTADICPQLRAAKVTEVCLVDPSDDWLLRRLRAACQTHQIRLDVLPDTNFLTPDSVWDEFAQHRKRWFFTDFYLQQRKRLGILLERGDKPVGGKWSFDTANRRRLPKDLTVPATTWPQPTSSVREAIRHVQATYPQAIGNAERFHYPTNREEALAGLEAFLDERFAAFGEYEDAIDSRETFLFHSVLTPALNVGLISAQEVTAAALRRSDQVPLNSLEGFIRQVIGWREYMRGVYRQFGVRQRTQNHWNHQRPMPRSFYDGTTGIEPVDVVIRRVHEHAYCHHIERLMILGNFMLLCEIDPDAIYQWFMEFFIDAYDWVMVPNIYGMSQHADGGLITTKPYMSGSSYVLKMSNFKRGSWCEIWDALYWRFVARHRDFFASNPRLSVMASQLTKMGAKLAHHETVAERFLNQLGG
ncbi:MAG: cryptochrome/photolyase family protein [Planctomycetota bacterium]